MTDPVTTPIMINRTPTADQIAAAIRYGVTALGSIFAALGYSGLLDSDKLNQLAQGAGPAAIVIAFVWGQISTRTQSKKLITMEPHVPNKVAQLK